LARPSIASLAYAGERRRARIFASGGRQSCFAFARELYQINRSFGRRPARLGLRLNATPFGRAAPAESAVLAGSCSTAIREQVATAVAAGAHALQFSALDIAAGAVSVDGLADWVADLRARFGVQRRSRAARPAMDARRLVPDVCVPRAWRLGLAISVIATRVPAEEPDPAAGNTLQ